MILLPLVWCVGLIVTGKRAGKTTAVLEVLTELHKDGTLVKDMMFLMFLKVLDQCPILMQSCQ